MVIAQSLSTAASYAADAGKLSSQEAAQHVGETATVCGAVASAKYADRSRRKPTFLNLDRAYPNQIFTVVIWGENRAKFGAPEHAFLGKRICAKGLIESYQGRPEIVATDPRQIAVQ